MKIAEIILKISVILEICLRTYANFFMATSQMDELIVTYGTLAENLEQYLTIELEILRTVDKFYKHFSEINVTVEFLDNPINAFILIRILNSDIDRVEKYADIVTGFERGKNVKYPDKIDLYGAAVGLKRIQDIYHLKFDDIVNGKLPGNVSTFPMEASECFYMGSYMYLRKDHTKTIDWFVEAIKKHKENDDSYFFRIRDVYELISESYFRLGDFHNALHWLNKVLFYEKDYRVRQRIFNTIYFYETRIEDLEIDAAFDRIAKKTKKKVTMDIEHLQDHELVKHYSKLSGNSKLCYLCRNKVILSNDVKKRLKCLYLKETHPFQKLAPLKIEQIYLNPNVTMIHNIIHDKDINYIIKEAKEKFKYIRTINVTNYKSTEYVLKTTSFNDEESHIFRKVSQRMAQFTSLGNTAVGPLQVSNYGVGGYYDPHYDCYREETQTNGSSKRNRTITVIFYLSDVAQGGLTVFPELGLSVSPKKGAAIFWSNLNSSGHTDPATSHASCPVLFGHKWEANKWVYQDGQPMEHKSEETRDIQIPVIV